MFITIHDTRQDRGECKCPPAATGLSLDTYALPRTGSAHGYLHSLNLLNRRIYRRKYDPQRVLNGFALMARDEVELDKLIVGLVEVVSETMQPVHATLWFKDDKRRAVEHERGKSNG